MQTIHIRKPLYGNFVYIREKTLREAIKDGALEVVVPNGSAIINPKEWIQTGKRMEKEFKIPGRPMVLYGNHVPT